MLESAMKREPGAQSLRTGVGWGVALVMVIAGAGCSSAPDDGCILGSEGCACLSDDRCDPGLSCGPSGDGLICSSGAGVGPSGAGHVGAGYAGLYFGFGVGYCHLWPEGHFVDGVPEFTSAARFDWETTFKSYKPEQLGDYTVTPMPGKPTRFTVVFKYRTGRELTDTLVEYKDGGWGLENNDMYKLSYDFREFGGVYTRETYVVTPGSNPAPGGTSTSLSVGVFSVLRFMPGNRFHYRNTSSVSTSTSIGASSGGSVIVGGSYLNSTPVNEGGSYTIEDVFLRMKFDSGAESLDQFRYLSGTNYSFLFWGGRQFDCEGAACVTN
jgi:hypothetical protein